MRRLGAVCLAVLGLLAVPAGAQAAKGVYDTFGTTGTQGGQFFSSPATGLSAVAVNSAGNGAADAGDVYVLDRGNNRIQQFDADGKFVRAFGQDVIVNTGTPNSNGTGYEICDTTTTPPNSAAECKAGITGGTGGAVNVNSSLALSGIAVDQASGDIFVTDRGNRRVQRFDASGHFLRAFGKNVVASGPEQADEQQRLTVDATAGQYKLTFNAQTTPDIAFDASAASVQSALEGLSSIGAGNVTVTGGPGSAGGGAPYLVAFGGTLADTDLAAIAVSVGTTPLSGGAGATIATFNDGATGYEVCTVAANCQGSPANAATGGAFHATNLNSLAIAPTGSPNVGNILVADGNNNRVQEFTPAGAFVRTFGWDVVASGPGNGAGAFEVCNSAALDICQAGVAGSEVGQFGFGSLSSIAEDSSGNIYTVEPSANFRVQKFTLPGNVVTPQGNFCGSGPAPGELCGTGIWNTTSDTPIALAVDTSTPPGTPGTIYLLKYFPAGSGDPPLAIRQGKVLQVDPTTAEVTATYMHGAEAGTNASLTSLALNTATGRLYVPEPLSARTFIVDEVLPVSITPEPTEAGATSATLHATITPAPLPSLPTFYRFEYTRAGANEWKRAPAEPNPDVNIGNGASPVAVSQVVEGLRVGTEYEVRVLAYSQFKGSEVLVEVDSFETVSQPPLVETGSALWSSPAPTNPSLTFQGTVNPGNDPTSFFFEYVSEEEFLGSGFDSARISPKLPGQAGQGLTDVGVLSTAAGLDPSKTYRYRLVAVNSSGTTRGDARTVAPPDPGARFFELVSDGDSAGLGVFGLLAVSDDGLRAVPLAQAIGDPSSLPAQRIPFLAQRGGSGWQVRQTNPFPESGRGEIGFAGSAWFPSDLSTALWAHSSPSEQIRGEVHWTFTDPDGAKRAALPKLVPVTGRATTLTLIRMKGAAANLSSYVFQREEATNEARTQVTYLPGQPQTTGGDGDLYRISGAGGPSPTLTLLNYDETGNLISNACGVWIGSMMNPLAGVGANANKGMSLRPVSVDGKVAYFSARPGAGSVCDPATEAANGIRVFKRIEDSSTVEISKSQCTRTVPTPCSSANGDDFFQGASANGNRVYFTTTRQLTDSDEDSTLDLYLFDSDPPAGQPELIQASAGEVVPTDHPKAGSGAEVQEGITDVSMDGSRAYFVAKGRLTSAATKGANNLYVFERDDARPSGRIAFVAKLDGTDSKLWGANVKQASAYPFHGPGLQGPGDGRYLLFVSKAKLAGADTDTSDDLYRFEDESGQTTCLTCAGNGNFAVEIKPHGASEDSAGPQRERFASEDVSTVAFATEEALVPEDENAVSDAYIWRDGNIELVSTGEADSQGIDDRVLPLLSADGSAVFFLTADRILPSDTNSAPDLYSARIGGGFPESETKVSCISPEECRTAPVVVAPTSAPASSSFSGPGNPQASRPTGRCPKHKVRRKGRCVKKKGRKAKKVRDARKRKANKNRRAGR